MGLKVCCLTGQLLDLLCATRFLVLIKILDSFQDVNGDVEGSGFCDVKGKVYI